MRTQSSADAFHVIKKCISLRYVNYAFITREWRVFKEFADRLQVYYANIPIKWVFLSPATFMPHKSADYCIFILADVKTKVLVILSNNVPSIVHTILVGRPVFNQDIS